MNHRRIELKVSEGIALGLGSGALAFHLANGFEAAAVSGVLNFEEGIVLFLSRLPGQVRIFTGSFGDKLGQRDGRSSGDGDGGRGVIVRGDVVEGLIITHKTQRCRDGSRTELLKSEKIDAGFNTGEGSQSIGVAKADGVGSRLGLGGEGRQGGAIEIGHGGDLSPGGGQGNERSDAVGIQGEEGDVVVTEGKTNTSRPPLNHGELWVEDVNAYFLS